MIERTDNRQRHPIRPEQLSSELMRRLPLEFLKRQRAIPILLEKGEPAVALADPLNIGAYDAIVGILGRPCRRVLCEPSEIEQAISRCYYLSPGEEENYFTPDAPESSAQTDASASSVQELASTVQTQAEDLLNIADKAPAIKLVNKILFHAVHSRASDIHIEPYEQEVKIRFRIDGVLRHILSLPKIQISPILSRLKIMANLNIAEHRLPQDGQSRVSIGDEVVDIRVSVIPTAGGERVVLRLLDKGRGELKLEEIGFGPDLLKTFRSLIGVSHGIVLITGPTGSGKTTTLYGALNELNSQERNILTVEDPVEYQLPGIGQMQVHPKIDLTFANCLRHILRQDPDIIMIGEIRDRETAEIAIQASLTGHLVLSTLHTNDAASAFTRLIDMGIEPYLISSTVVGVMAQRLVRVICPNCKQPYTPQEGTVSWSELEKIAAQGLIRLHQGAGCPKCLESGYMGRTGIFELLLVDDAIRDLIVRRQASHLIKEAALTRGMTTLRHDGLRRALEGVTTIQEVYRVTQDSVQIGSEGN
ncbi:MAG TPA: type II secretion system ATPase GspE [Sedimentisphaerales bacterium]|nr:type II secretion system ATPase GspE [Sedimentisphaerales bacterium]HQG47561.1 type II secretion system ATPase GspE [Sedimentisphaerales bacterium]HQI27856.1 type II secretion system ATPase GspE [Sedimentisphaerales bacterium]